MTPILGPAPCKGCRALVELQSIGWCDRGTLQRHRCEPVELMMAHPMDRWREPGWIDRVAGWLDYGLAVAIVVFVVILAWRVGQALGAWA